MLLFVVVVDAGATDDDDDDDGIGIAKPDETVASVENFLSLLSSS
jgi:hypothetical protein